MNQIRHDETGSQGNIKNSTRDNLSIVCMKSGRTGEVFIEMTSLRIAILEARNDNWKESEIIDAILSTIKENT